MKKTITIILIIALIATLTISLASCTGNSNEKDTQPQNVLAPELGEENETVKQPTTSDETEDWGLGEVPLH